MRGAQPALGGRFKTSVELEGSFSGPTLGYRQ